jgi:hypothetical protein
MSLVRSLTRPYAARGGAPVIRAVDDAIFTRRYYARCMACGFCRDACCSYGVDVDERVVSVILGQAEPIEAVVGVSREEWFAGAPVPDPEVPGGASRRTSVRDGYCVFHDPRGRGCLLHGYALATGQDYHALKPMVSTLFPLTFESGTLVLSDELEDGTLVCAGNGPTAYEAVRGELAYYFGDGMVAELDALAGTLEGA